MSMSQGAALKVGERPQLQLDQENEIICLLLQIRTSVPKVEHANRQDNKLKPGRRSPREELKQKAGSEWLKVPRQH